MAGRLLIALCLLFTACGSSGPNEDCPGLERTDPGVSQSPDLYGRVEVAAGSVTVQSSIRAADVRSVGGRPIRVDAHTKVVNHCSLSAARTDCDAAVMVRADGVSARRLYLLASSGSPQSETWLTTSSFRFDGDRVAVGDGLNLPLAANFRISCGDHPTREHLLAGDYGATFTLDRSSGTVAHASCNGCG